MKVVNAEGARVLVVSRSIHIYVDVERLSMNRSSGVTTYSGQRDTVSTNRPHWFRIIPLYTSTAFVVVAVAAAAAAATATSSK